jgi:hypothetical protein
MSWGLILASVCFSDVVGTDGNIHFRIYENSQVNMTLNQTGLGVGVTPSANLQVSGNAQVTESLSVGHGGGASNLSLSGSLGFSMATITSNTLVDNSSMILVDSSVAGANVDLRVSNSANNEGRVYWIKSTDGAHAVHITQDEGIFDKAYSNLTLDAGTLASVELMAQGNNYFILSQTGNVSLSLDASKIKDCVLWLDASDGNTLTIDGSGNVTQWLDKSQNNYVLADLGGDGSHPSITSNWRNGLNAMAFDHGTQEYLKTTTNVSFSNQALTVFLVFDNNTSKVDNNVSAFTVDGTGNPSYWHVASYSGFLRFGNQHSSISPSFSSNLTLSKSTPYLSTSWFDVSLQKKYYSVYNQGSGTVDSSSDANLANPLVDNLKPVWVGCQKINAGSAPEHRSFGGNVAEIMFYSRHLNTDEIQAIEDYLVSKWSL